MPFWCCHMKLLFLFPDNLFTTHIYEQVWFLRWKWDYLVRADALQLRAKSLSAVYCKYNRSFCLCGGRVDLQKWGCKLNTAAFLEVLFLPLLCHVCCEDCRIPSAQACPCAVWSVCVCRKPGQACVLFFTARAVQVQPFKTPSHSCCAVDLPTCPSYMPGISSGAVTEKEGISILLCPLWYC